MKSIYTSVRKNQAPLVLVGQIHSNEAFLSTSFPGNLWRNPIDATKIHQKVSFSATIAYSNQNNSATVSKLTFQAASTRKPMNCRSWLPWCWVACHSFDLSPKTSDNYICAINKTLLQPFFHKQCCQLWPSLVNTYLVIICILDHSICQSLSLSKSIKKGIFSKFGH